MDAGAPHGGHAGDEDCVDDPISPDARLNPGGGAAPVQLERAATDAMGPSGSPVATPPPLQQNAANLIGAARPAHALGRRALGPAESSAAPRWAAAPAAMPLARPLGRSKLLPRYRPPPPSPPGQERCPPAPLWGNAVPPPPPRTDDAPMPPPAAATTHASGLLCLPGSTPRASLITTATAPPLPPSARPAVTSDAAAAPRATVALVGDPGLAALLRRSAAPRWEAAPPPERFALPLDRSKPLPRYRPPPPSPPNYQQRPLAPPREYTVPPPPLRDEDPSRPPPAAVTTHTAVATTTPRLPLLTTEGAPAPPASGPAVPLAPPAATPDAAAAPGAAVAPVGDPGLAAFLRQRPSGVDRAAERRQRFGATPAPPPLGTRVTVHAGNVTATDADDALLRLVRRLATSERAMRPEAVRRATAILKARGVTWTELIDGTYEVPVIGTFYRPAKSAGMASMHTSAPAPATTTADAVVAPAVAPAAAAANLPASVSPGTTSAMSDHAAMARPSPPRAVAVAPAAVVLVAPPANPTAAPPAHHPPGRPGAAAAARAQGDAGRVPGRGRGACVAPPSALRTRAGCNLAGLHRARPLWPSCAGLDARARALALRTGGSLRDATGAGRGRDLAPGARQ